MTPAPKSLRLQDGSGTGCLADRIAAAPLIYDPAAVERARQQLHESLEGPPELAGLRMALASPAVAALIDGMFGCSPYLTGLALRHPDVLMRVLREAPEQALPALGHELSEAVAAARSVADAMAALRTYKNRAALLTALADLGEVWPIMTVTAALSETADLTLCSAVEFLLARAASAGDYFPRDPAHPELGSGYVVIAMGKHGARELNYSSDIDLIVFYERGLAQLRAGLDPQTFFVRLTRDLVRLMQERTPDGYVFRVDLRLRPDPGATQIALSTHAALHYYESFGQNWERAALIKARPVAGDIDIGTRLLRELEPYIWRKYLDFAAIADIHAMKRQIHAFKGFGEIGVAGHNIKVGRGGIREIEFFAQTQQLIAGGRQRELRTGETLVALKRLAERNWITSTADAELADAYRFLRGIEHRLQMIADEQTQTLPSDPDKLLRLARFAGFVTAEAFGDRLRAELMRVQGHYARLFEDVQELTSAGGNLVFTGDDNDPATVETITGLGYGDAAAVIATVKGWHFGRYPAMRSARARELLTEFLPMLLEALARTAEPQRAFSAFDRFLSELPAGVQLFSLLRSNPSLLRLIADIMGSAPRLAHILSRRTRVLDAVLDPGFFGAEPTERALAEYVRQELDGARDYQDRLDRARIVGSEQAFLIGVRVLSGTIVPAIAGDRYARLAEVLVQEMAKTVEGELAQAHGLMAGGSAAVVAMGKLGGREMAANSDLDLIVVYDYDGDAAQSLGARALPGQQYYLRYTQRLISSISALTAEGRLYEVDMRLRPSGNAGPVASRLSTFADYQRSAAWTWEHMALTRARVLSGTPALRRQIETIVHEVLTRRRDRGVLAADVRDMRSRIAAEKGTDDIWDLKQVRGGLVDLEFMVQFLQLAHAHEAPSVLAQNTGEAIERLAAAGFLTGEQSEALLPAFRLYQALSQIIRLCLDGPFAPASAPSGLKLLLSRAAEVPDFARAEALLAETEARVAALFDAIIQ